MIENAPALGKMPPKRYYGEIAAKVADFKTRGLPKTPPRWAWGGGVEFPVYLNEELPDCTCAAVGHHEQVWSARAGNAETPSDADVLEFFDYTGTLQGLGRDDGRWMEGCLKAWRERGFRQTAGDADSPAGSFERILGYAAVNPFDQGEVRAAGFVFGGLYVGIALPASAYQQLRNGQMWAYVKTDNAPGGWGGHTVNVTAINWRGPVCITWGKRQQMTWAFWSRYVDEAFVILSPDWESVLRKSPSGYAIPKLAEFLATLSRSRRGRC